MTQEVEADPAAHQPSKAEIEEDVSIDASPEALAWAVTRGGAERRGDAKSHDSVVHPQGGDAEMTNSAAIAARRVSDVLRPKGGDEMPVNMHYVPARNDPKPDYDAMRRIASGEPGDVDESDARKQR